MANRRTSRTRGSGCTKQQEKEIEVLFEWRDNRSIIKAKQSELLDRITEIFATFSGQDAQIHTLQSNRQVTGKVTKQGKYLLQRFVHNWSTYVNVDSINQVKNRDILTITQPSALSSTSTATESRSQTTLSKTKVPPFMHVFI